MVMSTLRPVTPQRTPTPAAFSPALRRTGARQCSVIRCSGVQTPSEGKGRPKGFKMPKFLKPLTDFGVGKQSVWEGGVGLFVIVGAGAYYRPICASLQ